MRVVAWLVAGFVGLVVGMALLTAFLVAVTLELLVTGATVSAAFLARVAKAHRRY